MTDPFTIGVVGGTIAKGAAAKIGTSAVARTIEWFKASRVLDGSGNLKAVQKLLGHSSIQTTADTYTDWDIEQLAQTLAEVLQESTDESFPRKQADSLQTGGLMEAAGIEPASADAPDRASTSVVCALISPGGRFADDLPTD